MSMAFGQLSGQEILDQILEYHVKNRGVQVHILDQYQHIGGMHLDTTQKIKSRIPWDDVKTIHFCWTHNIEVKAERMEQYNHKMIEDPCFLGLSKCKDIERLDKSWKMHLCKVPRTKLAAKQP